MKRALGLFFILLCGTVFLSAQEGLIPAFRLEPNELELQRLAQPLAPFDKIGHKFAILGFESGTFETWAYPLKLFRNFEFSFLTRNSTRPIAAKDIVRFISATPEATVLTFVHQSFTVRAIFLTPLEEAGALILLAVDSTEPLTIVCGFIPVLQPMWPAGLGGQYAYWDEKISAYILAESSRKNYGLVGSPAAEGISYTPAHMLADMPSEFKIEIKDPVAVSDKYIPIYMAGGKGKREEVIQTYQKIAANPFAFYRKNVEYFRSLQARTLRVTTPVQALNLALAWAKVSYDSLLVENPDVGTGLVAGWGSSGTGGRPGFGWFFGTDAYFNSLCLNAYGEFASSKKALLFTRKWQREDGKMAHELTQSAAYLNWFGDYGYAYIHGDTSPYYLCAAYDYYRMSGDRLFIQECWDSLKRAYLWSKGTDANGDGLMDNRQAGLGALEFGALAGIETDIYLAAVWTQAARAMQLLAETVGDVAFSHRAAADFQKARETLNDKFWNNPEGFFVYAFNNRGEQVGEITPWLATPLFWQLTDFAKGTASLQKLCGSEMATDWGVRSLSSKSHFYEPLNYNYGDCLALFDRICHNGHVQASPGIAGVSPVAGHSPAHL